MSSSVVPALDTSKLLFLLLEPLPSAWRVNKERGNARCVVAGCGSIGVRVQGRRVYARGAYRRKMPSQRLNTQAQPDQQSHDRQRFLPIHLLVKVRRDTPRLKQAWKCSNKRVKCKGKPRTRNRPPSKTTTNSSSYSFLLLTTNPPSG